MNIQTLPVYSKLADEAEVRQLGLWEKLPINPDGSRWRLSQHQVETYKALVDPNGPAVIFNTAMTGDGKSLAGQLPSLVKGWHLPLFAMYPTNELIRDQLRQAELTWARWQQPSEKLALDSHTLDRLMLQGDFGQRGEGLLSLLRNYEVVLTNPDIFHYIMQMFYVRTGKQGDAPDKVFEPLVHKFEQFTFDEFHIFETPQVISVINAMLLIFEATLGHRRRFLFQSATPNALMMEYLQRAGLRTQVIAGQYKHVATQPDSATWRQILQGCEIHFDSISIDEWIEAHLEDVLIPFFRNHRPAAKGAIIVNSVAQAHRLTARLRSTLAPYNIIVKDNTGLTSRSRRSDSYAADILVGTSTVDVGVDFQINFLLFECRDAGTFLQRLGRLGRHASYERDGQTISFQGVFQAYALLPPWIIARLFESTAETPAPLTAGAEVDRERLADVINDAFPQPVDFRGYAKAWGGLQSARVIGALGNRTIRESYAETRQQLEARYEATFDLHLAGYFRRYKELKTEQPALLEEAISFRGGSYFECGLLDHTETGADQIKTYDLLALLPSAELHPLSAEEFWQTVTRFGVAETPIRRCEPVAFFRLAGFAAERSNFRIKLQHDIGDWGENQFGVARVLTGITIEHDSPQTVPDLNGINRRLQQRPFPALLCRGFAHPLEIKRGLRLPLLFPLYPFVSRDRLNGVIAFGREALLLEVALKRSGIKCGGDAAIIL
jgi:CRISPR-associated endonuclease/helicase Cas3